MRQYAASYNVRPKTMAWVKFIVCIVGALGAGVLSVYFSGAWRGYGNISVSSVTPPNYAMYIIWTIFYVLAGASLFAVIDHETYTIRSQNLKSVSIVVWAAQFVMTLFLPFLTFMLDLYMLTFVLSALITAFVAALIVINLKLNAPASILLWPCFVWIMFQTYLNLILVLNNF